MSITRVSDTHHQSLQLATVGALEALVSFAEDCPDATRADIVDGIRDIINDARFIDLAAGEL